MFGKKYILLLLILILGLFLRVYQLGSNPPSMHADEADTGYTALSLIKTGKDPYGYKWPLHFKDQASNYRAPLYTYSVIPFVYLFGLSPEATRLPSVLFGTGLILIVFLTLQYLFKNYSISFIGAFLTAINPWSIHLSRTGLEVHLSLFLTSLGVLFFLMRERSKWFFYFSAVFFGLSLFAYHPAKIFSPLMIIFLFSASFREIKKSKFAYLTYTLIFSFFVAVIGYLAIFDSGASRLTHASIFDKTRAFNIVNTQRSQTTAPLQVSSIFANKPVYYLREFVNHYTGVLSVNYLFINGDNSLDKGIGNYGQYHLFELLPFIFGFIYLFNKNKKIFIFLSGWFLIGIIPAGITENGYYSYRDVNALVPPIIISSVGVYEGFKILRKKRAFIFTYLFLFFSVIISMFFLYNYYFSYPVYSRDWWAYGQKNALEYIHQNKGGYKNIYIHGGTDWAVGYAFYNRVDPLKFQKSYENPVTINGQRVQKIDGIYIGNILGENTKNIPEYIKEKSLLIVPGDYFNNDRPIKSFFAVDGTHVDLNAFEVK